MLADVPMVFILVGITAYTVLSGADFGAGLWTLIPGGGRAGVAATREHTRHAIGPVWEANHVWLIFVLTVAWTCYPVAFGSIVSTLSIPLFIAAVGIILRGATYALRSQLEAGTRRVALVEDVFALSSVLTPFALATVIGGIATGRVPVGNARGNLITSWLNPVSVLAGVLAVAFSGYLAAVYLAADASRLAERDLVRDFRARGLVTGVLAGALALAGLFVVRASGPRYLWNGLTSGLGLALVCVCALAGVVTMVLVWVGRFGLARASAALVPPAFGDFGAAVSRRQPVAPPRHRHAERGDVERELLTGPGGHHLAGGEPHPRPAPVQAHEPGGQAVPARPDQHGEALGAPPRHPPHVGNGLIGLGGRNADRDALRHVGQLRISHAHATLGTVSAR